MEKIKYAETAFTFKGIKSKPERTRAPGFDFGLKKFLVSPEGTECRCYQYCESQAITQKE